LKNIYKIIYRRWQRQKFSKDKCGQHRVRFVYSEKHRSGPQRQNLGGVRRGRQRLAVFRGADSSVTERIAFLDISCIIEIDEKIKFIRCSEFIL